VDENAALIDAFRAVGAEAQRLVDDVQPDQWHAPTPCTDWDVRQLVNHVAFGSLLFARVARGERDAFPPSPEERAADHLGDDPAAAFKAALQQLLDAFEAPGFFDGTYVSPLGEIPGAGLVQMRLTEQLIHGWDLARATSQQPEFPEPIVDQVLARMRQQMSGVPRRPEIFHDEQPAPQGASSIDQLAAFVGRAV
jgi:uncharacterized protein (TIGR03086 family)